VGEIGRPGADVQRKIADRASSSKIFWMKIKKVECKTRPRCMNDQIDFSFFAEKNKFPSQMVSALVWCFFPPQTLCCKHNKWSQLSGLVYVARFGIHPVTSPNEGVATNFALHLQGKLCFIAGRIQAYSATIFSNRL